MRRANMNVLFIIPRLYGGGAERIIATIASALSDTYGVYLVTHEENRDYPVGDAVHTISIGISNNNTNMFNKMLRLLVASSRIRAIKKKYNIQVSVSFLEITNFENVLSKVHDKTVISVRSNYFDRDFPYLKRVYLKYTNKMANRIVSISEGLRRKLIECYEVDSKKVLTIYNPYSIALDKNKLDSVDDEEFMEIRRKSGCLFLSVGRLIKEKGQCYLIKSFQDVVRRKADAHLVIVGEGEYRAKLNALIDDLDLKENVHLIGKRNNISFYYNEADIFVFSSISEGFANVILEAMAFGLPIISTDYDFGAREILAPDTALDYRTDGIEKAEYGILVNPLRQKYSDNRVITTEERNISEAMILAMSDEKIRDYYARKGRERVNDFSVENIKKQWIQLIDEMANMV